MKTVLNVPKVFNTSTKRNMKANLKDFRKITQNKNAKPEKIFDLAFEEMGYYLYNGQRICIKFPR